MELYTGPIIQLQKMYVSPKTEDASLYFTLIIKELTYKYHRIRINLGYQLDDKPMAVGATRAVVAHENTHPAGMYSAGATGDYANLFVGKDIKTMAEGEVWIIIRRLCDLD